MSDIKRYFGRNKKVFWVVQKGILGGLKSYFGLYKKVFLWNTGILGSTKRYHFLGYATARQAAKPPQAIIIQYESKLSYLNQKELGQGSAL